MFAISYDPVDILADFSERQQISYPLLSDEGSVEIKRLGLLNEHLEEQHGYYGIQLADRHVGVPYPGSFILDEDGIVQSKVFEQSYRVRPTAIDLLDASFGEESQRAGARAQAQTPELSVAAWTAAETYRPYQKLQIQLGFQVQPGLHVYGKPIPDGYYPLEVEIEPLEDLETGQLELPEPRPYRVAGLDEQFQVFDGEFRCVLPAILTNNTGDVQLNIRISYQACTETECFPPAEVMLALELKGLDNIRS